VGLNKCPIGAIDGSRGIHPTGLMRHTRFIRRVRDGGICCTIDPGNEFPVYRHIVPTGRNNLCPIGAIDGSRGIHPTGCGDTHHSSVAYATVGYVVSKIRGMNSPSTIVQSLCDEKQKQHSNGGQLNLRTLNYQWRF